MDAYKKTALILHGLSDVDRSWILGNIQAHQREQLLLFLEELETLGIPRRHDLIQSIDMGGLEQSPVDSQSGAPETEPPEATMLLDTSSEILHFVLKTESPALIAAVLLAYDWPWRLAVLNRFNDADRQIIQAHMDAMEEKLTEKVSETVIAALIDKLKQCREVLPDEAEENMPGPGGRKKRWFIFRR